MNLQNSIAEAMRRGRLWFRDGNNDAGKASLPTAESLNAGPRTPVLLEYRLTALRLDPAEIGRRSPAVLRDLRRTCRLCTDKQRCLDDMMECLNPPGWESYCPNSGTIRTLL